MKNRTTLLVLVAIAGLGVAACGEKKTETPATTTEQDNSKGTDTTSAMPAEQDNGKGTDTTTAVPTEQDNGKGTDTTAATRRDADER